MSGTSDGSPSQKGVTFDDWMSESDALMWRIENDPLLRSTVLSVWLLDRPPDAVRFRATLDRTLTMVPRLRQRVAEDPLGVSPPRWEPDPYFDIDYHVRRVRAPGSASLRELLDLAAPIAMQAFDKDRPLWELHCVEGVEVSRFGIILKVHHAMTDGVGMVRMTEGLVERSREAGAIALPAGDVPETVPLERGELLQISEAVLHRAATAVGRGRRAVAAMGRGLVNLAGRPLSTAGELLETIESVGRLVRPVSEPMSSLWRGRSMANRLDVLEVPVEDLKRTARAVDGTLNDVFVAAVAGGLSRYHADLDAPVEELRMSMPINVREEGDKGRHAGNQFVPARFPVPMGFADPRERVRAIHDLVRRQREEPALALLDEITAVINVFGETAATRLAGAMMKALDFVTSNVPGPRFPVYMSGARIERMYPFGPTAGAAVNITLFSYDGIAQVGINSDRAAVAEPRRLLSCLRAGFDEMLRIGRG